MKKRLIQALAIVALVCVAFTKLDFVNAEGGGGAILWSNDEAYLLMWDAPSGYRLSVLDWLLEPVKEMFYAPVQPRESKLTLTVLRISPNGVERHEQEEEVGFRGVVPVGDKIYVGCPGGICSWTGSEFRLIPEEEATRIGGETHLLRNDFSGVEGWSGRGIRSAVVGEKLSSYNFSIELRPDARLIVSGPNPVTIDLVEARKTPQRIWYHEQKTRIVSNLKYHQIFPPH